MHLPDNPNQRIDYTKQPLETIYLAGGCFWGTDAFMARIPGVAETQCGYANGHLPNPTYEQVCNQRTGHAETVMVRYAPALVSLEKLLAAFFETINPTMKNRQGGDVGSQYRSGIYYQNDSVVPTAEKVMAKVQERYEMPIVTELLPLTSYYPAEEYHQRYLEKNPNGYCHVDLGKLPS